MYFQHTQTVNSIEGDEQKFPVSELRYVFNMSLSVKYSLYFIYPNPFVHLHFNKSTNNK